MKLREYLKKSNLTHKEFAKRVGVTQPQITRVANFLKTPSVNLIEKIYLETNGEVTYEDLIRKSSLDRKVE